MYAVLIFVPVFNFLDGLFNIFPASEGYLIALSVLYFVVAIITAYLAIKHFVSINKIKNGKE